MKSFTPRNLLSLSLTAVLFGAMALTGCTPDGSKGTKGGSSSLSQTDQTSSDQDNTDQGNNQNTENQALENVKNIVSKSSNGQFTASKLFDGPAGMTGVLVEQAGGGGGQKLVAWTNKEGTILMPGPMFDKDGVNLTETILSEQAGYVSPEKLAEQVVDKGFMAGKSGPIVTVFFEPYCGYCNALFEKMEPMIDKGEIRVRFIMVAFLRPDSAARAADIENASNPYNELKKWEKLKNKEDAKDSKSTEAQQAAILENNNLMNSAGQTGTPALLSCNKTTKQVEMTKGMPADYEGFIANVGEEGNPACG